jgi:hypothetical protein
MRTRHPRLNSLTLALAGMLAGLAATPASAATCTWNTASGNWAAIVNWTACATGNGTPAQTPGAADTANIGGAGVVTINTGQQIRNLNNAGQITIDAFGLNLVGGGGTFNSGVLNVGGLSTANLGVSAGHNIDNTGGVINIAAGSVVNQFGSSITGGTINTTGTGALVVFGSSSNVLNGVTLGGRMDMASGFALQRITNGLTLNSATVDIANSSVLSFEGTSSLAGTGSIVFGAVGGSNNRLYFDGNGTTTFAAGTTVRGHSGSIGGQINIGGTQVLVNNGTISADVAGGTISFTDSAVTNNGTLSALNGGTLVLGTNVTGGASGQIVAGAGSTVLQGGVTLNGTINTSGGGQFRPTGSASNFLDGVTFNGDMDMASAFALQRVTAGGLVLNGTINVANSSVLSFEGDGGLSGNGTILLGSAGGSNNRIYFDGNGTTTFAAGTTVRGHSGSIGSQINIGGTQVLVNNGTVSADVAGGTISFTDSAVTNNGTLSALNGGTLVLGTNVTGGASGQIVAGAGSTVLQGGVTLSGTINTSGGGQFRPTGSASNFLDGVTFNGDMDMASAFALQRVTAGGLVLNGTINIANASVLSFEGDGGLSGNGTIVLGSVGSTNNRIYFDGNGTTTFAAGTTVRGHTGTIGSQINIGGTQTLVNNGTVSADVAGGTITIVESAVTNNGTLSALNGGTLVLGSNVTGGASGQIVAGAGSTVLQSGITISGTINTSGNGQFRASGSSSNFLNGVTLNGNLDMASAFALERVTAGGLVLNGTINVANASVLSFEGDGGLSGNGTIVLGSVGSTNNRIYFDGNGTTTFAAGTMVRGHTGTIGSQINIGGTQTLVNNGTINAELAGGSITFTDSALVNNGLVRAQAGTMNVGVALSGTGTLQVDSTGAMNLANGAKTQGTLTLGAAGAALNVNTGNLTIVSDYTNAAWGSGNSFARRTGITGTGLIVTGGNAAQAVTGAGVSNGNTANATLTLGNVRVGGTTFNYQIANTGTTGPTLRGAIQTNLNGGNLTDTRLSGAGVAASNYSAGAPSSSSGNLGVTFTTASAGPLAALTGQALNLRSNFENIADQKLNIVVGAGAAAFNMAGGNATPSPVQLAAQRVGGSVSTVLGVSNTATAGAFSEDLNASFSGFTGAASGSGSIVGRLAGSSNTGVGSMSVGVDSATSGAKTGTATLAYATAGAVNGVSNGLGVLAVGTQTITVNGNVYAPAVALLNTPAVNFGTVRVGDVVAARNLSVSNTNSGALTDTLRASLAGGAAPFTTSGTATGVAAGSTNASSLSVALNTATAGVFNSSRLVTFTSQNPEMADLALGTANVALSATVNNLAASALAKSGGVGTLSGGLLSYTLNLGSVVAGQSGGVATLSLSNTASGPADALAGSFSLGALQPGDPFALGGFSNFAGLAAGNTLGGLTVSFGGLVEGSFDRVLVLNRLSTNGSGPDLNLAAVELRLQGTVTAVPEPGTWALWLAGLAVLGGLARRRARAA